MSALEIKPTGSGLGYSDRDIQMSQAISLKRIADSLEHMDVTKALTMSINSYGENIGEAIQGQMVRGQAGIDQYEHLKNR